MIHKAGKCPERVKPKKMSRRVKLSGTDNYCYFNKDGSIYLTSEFGEDHKLAGLVGRFDFYIYPEGKKAVFGYWRKYESDQKIMFEKNDDMHNIFKGEKL